MKHHLQPSLLLHRRFDTNRRGRDFFVGDVHGYLDILEHHMRRVGFNADRDRLFLMGDMIDRGPFSQDTLEFLLEPYVFSSFGNHELMLLQVIAFIAHHHQKGTLDAWMEMPDKWKTLGYMGGKDAAWLQAIIEAKDWDTLWHLGRLIQQHCFLIGTVNHPQAPHGYIHFTHSVLPFPSHEFIHDTTMRVHAFAQGVSDNVFDFSLGKRFQAYQAFGHQHKEYNNQQLTIVGHYGIDTVSYFDNHILMDVGAAQQDLALHTLDELLAIHQRGLL